MEQKRLKKAIDKNVQSLRRCNADVLEFKSADEMKANPSSTWKPINPNYIAAFNILEPEILYCYTKAIFTINMSQGQHRVFQIGKSSKRDVIVAPPGGRSLPPMDDDGNLHN